ncbi:MAG: gliding motility lipoprotein GldD [Flavobacteriales bacterium]
MKKIELICLLFSAVLLFSCGGETYTPKPKGYFRIDLPEKKYEQAQINCPFSFEKPIYTAIKMVEQADKPCWFNLDFTTLQASLYFSYNLLDNNIDKYLEDSRTLAFKHSVKATDIEQIVINYPQKNVYGLIYDIKGNAASEFQFHLTDSVNHFLVGSLYFNTTPNQDSIQPVLDFVKQDIEHLFSTFEWKK